MKAPNEDQRDKGGGDDDRPGDTDREGSAETADGEAIRVRRESCVPSGRP